MRLQSLQQLIEAQCKEIGNVTFNIRYNKSNKPGKTCIAIVGPTSDVKEVIAQVSLLLLDEVFNAAIITVNDLHRFYGEAQSMMHTLLRFSDTDTIGTDTVVYWPTISSVE